MRKASVGIAAAVLLTTLVILVVPASAQGVGPPKFCDSKTGICLTLNIDPTKHTFILGLDDGKAKPVVLCSGVGAIVVKNVLSIPYGKCMKSDTGASFLTGGGKIFPNKPIVVALVYLKPTHVDIFKLIMIVY
jgi:hypothetical protein